MADRSFATDGQIWSVRHAEDLLDIADASALVEPFLATLADASRPVPRQWLGDRLTVMWTMFASMRTTVDAGALTVWLSECLRLLADLPHDIAGVAIDQAIRTCQHGFMPSIGEIRSIADPLIAEREEMLRRLGALSIASSDPERVREREKRRQDRAASKEMSTASWLQ